MSDQQVLIISGHRNWVFKKSVFLGVSIVVASTIFAVIVFLLYWYLYYYLLLNEKSLIYNEIQIQNTQLTEYIEEMGAQHEKELDELKYRYHSEVQDVRRVLRVVESLALTLKNAKNSENILDQINRLRGHIERLTINSYSEANKDAPLSINRFRAINNGSEVHVQFQIKSFDHTKVALKLAVIPLSQKQLNMRVTKELGNAQTIKLDKIHYFKKSFTYSKPDEPFAAMRIILWDRNQKVLFEQNYPILKR